MTHAEARSCRINALALDWLVLFIVSCVLGFGLSDGTINPTLAYSLIGVTIPYALLTAAETVRQVIQAKKGGNLSRFCGNFFNAVGGTLHREPE